MDIDFHCTRRRCPIRGIMDAKREMERAAYEGPEDNRAKREALKIMLDLMLYSAEHEDETAGMSKEQLEEWAKTHGPR